MTLLDRLKMSKFDDILQEHERIYRVYILEELKLAKDSACKFADNENMSAVAQILTTTVKHMQYCNPKFCPSIMDCNSSSVISSDSKFKSVQICTSTSFS